MNEGQVFRDHFTVAADALLLIENAIVKWHTALERAEPAVVALVVTSVGHTSLRAAAHEASRELTQLHERGRSFLTVRRWIVRLAAAERRWDAFALEDTAELVRARGPDV